MAAEAFEHIQRFTREFGTISLKQDDVGVTGEATAPGILIYEKVWQGGPYATLPEAMQKLDQELGKWLENKW